MLRKCKRCGKDFEAFQNHHFLCPQCYSGQPKTDISQWLLKAYYKDEKNLVKEIFLDVPNKLANIFFQDKMSAKQLRDFFQKIKKARNIAYLQGIETAKPILYQCQRDLEYQVKRNIVPQTFVQFMKHHLILAEKSARMLDGFYEHLESILAYFSKEKGGM